MRGFFVWLAVLLLLAPSARAEGERAYAVYMDGKSFLVSESGGLLAGPETCGSIYRVSEEPCPRGRELFAVAPKHYDSELLEERYMSPIGLMDAEGTLLTDCSYDSFSHDPASGVVIFRRDGMCGVMSERGEILLDAAYGEIHPNGDGGYLALSVEHCEYDAEGYLMTSELVYIAPDGVRTDTGIMTRPYLAGFEGGLTSLAVYLENWRYGYVNEVGELVIEPIYEDARDFAWGYGAVSADGIHYGLIDLTGDEVLAPDYNGFDNMQDSRYLLAWFEGGVDLIRYRDLETVKRFAWESAEENAYATLLFPGVMSLTHQSETAFYDMEGEPLLSISTEAGDNAYAYYSICEGEPKRLIYYTGQWPNLQSFLIDLAGDRIAGPYDMLDALWWKGEQGRFLVTSYSTYTAVTGDGVSEEWIDERSYRYGVIDQDGEAILPTVYQSLSFLDEDRYWAKSADAYGLIDESGNWILKLSEYSELLD